jgi:hypothetical protein
MNRQPLLILFALAVPPLAAQHPAKPAEPRPMGHTTGDPMGMQEMMAPMMHVMLYTPQHLLARKDALGLTADQVARLTKVRDATLAAQDAAMTEAKAHLEELQQAADAPSPDTAALKIHFQAAHVAMGNAHLLALVSAVQAKAILNDAQRLKLKTWADSMHAWMEQHHQMMKPSEKR